MDSGFLRKLINSVAGRRGKPGGLEKLTDEELVKIYVDSAEEHVFEEIVGRYADRVYRLALRIVRDPEKAEDVFQDTFTALAAKSHTFRGDSKFSSWLYRITLNMGYMRLRSVKKQQSTVSIDEYAPYDEKGTLMGKIVSKDWSGMPDRVLYSKETLSIINNIVNELPESHRIVFHLRDVEGMTNEETAQVLDISVPAVKSRLHRTRLYLRDKLSEYFY
jgi:RNA polymerase sigma-70 factor (ECF subfamily)